MSSEGSNLNAFRSEDSEVTRTLCIDNGPMRIWPVGGRYGQPSTDSSGESMGQCDWDLLYC